MSINQIILLLLIMFFIQIILQIYSILDLFKRENFKFLNRNIWGAIIVFGNLPGTIIYLCLNIKKAK